MPEKRNKNKKKIEASSRNCTILNGGTQVSIHGTGYLYDRDDVKILPDYYLDEFDKASLEAVKRIHLKSNYIIGVLK